MSAIKQCGADALNYGLSVAGILTYTPTQGSTGIVRFNLADYDGTVAVYLEINEDITYNAPLDSGPDGYARLYDKTNSVAVTGSEIHFFSNGRKRSGDISSYFSGKGDVDVYLQIKCGNSDTTIVGWGWRLIVTQSGIISKTVIYIPISGNLAITGTTYAEDSRPKRWAHNATNYDGTIAVYFAATLTKYTANTMYAKLYDNTAAADITGGELTSTSATEEFKVSGNIASNLTNGNELTVYEKVDSGTGIIRNAFLIIKQTGINNGTGKFQTVMQITNNYRTNTITSYDTGPVNNQYNPSDWNNATINFKGEYVIKRTSYSGTPSGQAHLTDDGTEISGSELTTTSSTYERKTTGSLTTPASASKINDGIKLTGSGTLMTVYITSSRVILTITNLGAIAGPTLNQLMRHGKYFDGGEKPMTF
ncbi:MAG: hypothetical protein AB1467_06755 [Candidatus Diapherotrites archaeon]